MEWIFDHLLISLCYFFLYSAVISLWFPKRWKWWAIFLILSVIFGLSSGILQLIALIPIILLIIFLSGLESHTLPLRWRMIAGIFTLILASAMEGLVWPGYNHLIVLNKVLISHDGAPFTLKLNFSKTTAGVLLLAFTHPLLRSVKDWGQMLLRWLPRAMVVIAVLMFFAFILKYIHFDPKIPASVVIFAISNLLCAAMAEEALFRGFMQRYLMYFFRHLKFGNWLAIIGVAFLFGCAHLWGGYKYMMLTGIAGLGYGWVYDRTKSIEASILTHFSLNFTHFLLFTYPALRSALAV